MKTTPFLIRIAICLILSLVPLTELENRIYSMRLSMRSHSGEQSKILILRVPSSEFANSQKMEAIQANLKQEQPSLILVNYPSYWANLITDPDGLIRRSTLYPKGRPSLAYLAYSNSHTDLSSLKQMKDPHLINYLGPAKTFPHCTFSLHGALPANCPPLKGKIVLISSLGNQNFNFYTPVGNLSEAEITANDIHTILYHNPIYPLPFLTCLLISLAMIILSALLIIYYPVLLSAIAIIAIGVVVIVLGFQVIFQLFEVYIPSANLICSLLITYLIFTGYRLAFQENLQWRSLQQAQYLRELDRMKTNFLTLVSHDLKTPLAKIQMMIDRMRRELAIPSEQRSDWKEFLDSIEKSNQEMNHFITSVLNLSKIESQRVILNKKSNDLNHIINQTVKRLKPLAQQKNLQIVTALDPLFSIECDEDLVRQVLTNLIDNAIKYSPNHSTIHIRSQEDESFVRIDVEDFGPGIPQDQLPLMFRKFGRFLRPLQQQVKGTGLGLYLSKYFIELHGGTIKVSSTEGKGTTFSFTLPLETTEVA